jgi:radical SAM superfamily enzyme YgiQ (UPF0313 family)
MKIGLLALSGIRAADPLLLELGLTLPGFVERSRQVAALPSLGLLYLAAVTPEGHELSYHEAQAEGEESPELETCDLVAISTFSAQAFEAYTIADRLRARGVIVAIGGLHATALPDEAKEHADFVVVGEGENVWPELVRRVERGEEGSILRASDFPPVDLDRLPVPRYDLLGDRPYNRYTIQTSRGCPWRCEFCASTVMFSQRHRRRPVAHIIRDIEAILLLQPDAFIEFADDNTFVDKRWGLELCRALEPLGIRWFTETDISVADDSELLAAMKRAGCRQLLIGLEAPRREGLEGIELRTGFKMGRFPYYRQAIERIQGSGITVNGCFILGLDGQGPGVFDDVLEFVETTGLYEVQVTHLTAFPGTPLHDRLLEEGRIIEPGRWDLCTLFDVNFEPKRMSVTELREGMYRLSEQLYAKEAIERRRAPFFTKRRSSGQGRRAS